MWLCSAVERCPRGWFFLDRGILESIYVTHLSTQHSEPRVNHGDAISIQQGNTYTAKDDCG